MKSTATRSPSCLSGVDLRNALESAGWRFTKQRAAVFGYLRAAHCHPTAEQVFDAVRGEIPKISLATVYKALEALVDCGLADKLTASDGPARYDLHSGDHYHVRCLKTGKVCDLPATYDPGLVEKLDPSLL